MVVLAAKSLKVNSAKEFVDSISTASMNVNLYIGISHAEPWANDILPDTPVDNQASKISFWRDLIGGKKFTGNDVCLVVPRVNWAANTAYAEYIDSSSAIYGTNFYVVTDTFNVYKCLDNNASALSTVKPTYTSVNVVHKESDGYIWKFMGSVSTSDQSKFLTSAWMPVRTLLLNDASLQWQVQQAAIDGSIDVVNVTTGGTGYTNGSNITIAFSGDGSLAAGTANVNATSQTISFVSMTTVGSGYHFANAIISGGGGSGGTLAPVIPPTGGHGANPIEELGASNVMINIKLRNTENNKISVQNDFRQVGIIKNPYTFGTTNTYSNSVFSQAFGAQLSSGAGSYTLDEYAFQGTGLASSTFSGRVLNWDSTNNAVTLTQVQGVPTTAALVGLTSGASRFVISTTNPDLVSYSGTLLYVDNIIPVQRATDQDETIILVLSF